MEETDKEKPPRPFWMPDTQGLLAFAIVAIISFIVVILLLKEDVNLNEKVHGALLMLLGVLTGCFKDVYSFFFGSSSGSAKKDDAMIASTITSSSGTGSGGTPAAVTAAAEAAAPAAAAAAAPEAAADAAPPAANVAVPPAVEAELDRRGVPDKPKD